MLLEHIGIISQKLSRPGVSSFSFSITGISILSFFSRTSFCMCFIAYSNVSSITVLIIRIIIGRASIPKNLIAYPIGITNSPSPIVADIAKLAVLEGDSPYPWSITTEKKSAYIAERQSAEEIEPTQATIRYNQRNCRNTTIMVEATSSLKSTLSRYYTGPDQQSRAKRARVLTIQNIEAIELASRLSATCAFLAQVGSQLAQPTSSATQKKKSRQMQSSATGLRSRFFFFYSDLLTSWWVSGERRKRKGRMREKKKMPMALKAYSSKMMTIKGPMSPPIPKQRLSICSQQSWSGPAKSSNTQRLQRMLSMQEQAAQMNMLTKRFQKEKLKELTTRETPNRMIKKTNRVQYLYFLARNLMICPPAKQPSPLARNIKAKQVSSLPVTRLKQRIMGPTPVATELQRMYSTAQIEK